MNEPVPGYEPGLSDDRAKVIPHVQEPIDLSGDVGFYQDVTLGVMPPGDSPIPQRPKDTDAPADPDTEQKLMVKDLARALQAAGPDEYPYSYYMYLAKCRVDEHTNGLHSAAICGRDCGGCVAEEEGGDSTAAILVDFLLWLGKRHFIQMVGAEGEPPKFGPKRLTAAQLNYEYWLTYQ